MSVQDSATDELGFYERPRSALERRYSPEGERVDGDRQAALATAAATVLGGWRRSVSSRDLYDAAVRAEAIDPSTTPISRLRGALAASPLFERQGTRWALVAAPGRRQPAVA